MYALLGGICVRLSLADSIVSGLGPLEDARIPHTLEYVLLLIAW